MLTIIRGPQVGTVPLLEVPVRASVMSERPTLKWNVRDIRTELFQRIELVQTLLTCICNKLGTPQMLLR